MTGILPQSEGSIGSSKWAATHSDWQHQNSMPSSYPQSPHDGGVTELIHGVQVNDPWRSLEDLETTSTQAFVLEQNEVCHVISARLIPVSSAPAECSSGSKCSDRYRESKLEHQNNKYPKETGGWLLLLAMERETTSRLGTPIQRTGPGLRKTSNGVRS